MEKPVRPKKKLLLLAGCVLALLSSAGYAVVAETLDQTFRSPEQVEAELGLPVLASVPQVKRRGSLARKARFAHGVPKLAEGDASSTNASNGKLATRRAPDQQPTVIESYYQALAGRLRGTHLDGATETPRGVRVGIVHCSAESNGSSVATQLAINARSTRNEPILLVDADTTQRSVGRQFGVNGSPGLSDVLHGKAELETCVLDAGMGHLSVLAAGADEGCPLPYCEMSRIAKQLDGVAEEYGMIIVDFPIPSAAGAEIAAAAQMDAVLLVVEAETTRIHAARHIKQQLSAAGANVLGVVFNGHRHHIPDWLYHRV